MRPPIITFTTDFGADSPYVAQMKASVLQIEPDVRLVDISHSIGPQQILEGAVILSDTCPRFPPGTIHVAVVDPGVGTKRPIIAARIESHIYIAPDNGLLSIVASQQAPERIIRLNRSEYWQPRVSRTFHGRDIMAPVAAHLARGMALEQLGEPANDIVRLDNILPRVEDSVIEGRCLLIDSFGNLLSNITLSNITRAMLPKSLDTLRVQVEGQTAAFVSTYGDADPGTLVALFGSSDRLEIAQVMGSAATTTGLGIGCRIIVRWP